MKDQMVFISREATTNPAVECVLALEMVCQFITSFVTLQTDLAVEPCGFHMNLMMPIPVGSIIESHSTDIAAKRCHASVSSEV